MKWAILLCAVTVYAQPRFEPSEVCSMCHSRLSSQPDAPIEIAPYALWSGTMKANSARDPYWKAKVREEAALNPAAAALIEDTCLRCHAPAQQHEYRGRKPGMRFSELGESGDDGVTCSLCHQITAAGFGRKASFTAGFEIGAEEKIFGPHANPFSMPMLHHTGYQPVESRHVLDSALCGTCHTVITRALDRAGNPAGEFVEQAPYLEWLAGSYSDEGRTCQSCHMPLLRNGEGQLEASYIAHRPPGGPFPPTSPRTPFGRHSFSGGNVQGPEMLAELLKDRVGILHQASGRARDMLSAAVRITGSTSWREGVLELEIRVENRTGHKLPTAYPSRRLWLHVRVVDGSGNPVFESGAWDPATSEIRGISGVQPHYSRISNPGQVMIYEAEHGDLDGRGTTSLLRAARYLKDNRILPRGFDPSRRLPDGMSGRLLAPVGTERDPDFVPGSDQVMYAIPGRSGPRPARIFAEAVYQSIKPAHAAATSSLATPESRLFATLYARHRDPVVIARLEILVP
jgi:hypothetical protein